MLITTQELVSALESIDELIEVLTEELDLFNRPVLVREHFDKNGEPIDVLNQAEALQSWVEWEDREIGQTLIEDCQDMAIQMVASEVVPVFLHTLRIAGRVRKLHPREFDGDVQELRDCLQNDILADVFPVTKLIQGLGRLTSSIQGEAHHQLPVAPPSLTEFSEELMKLLAQKPELMHKTSPIVFERVVGAMFKRFNMDVAFTQQTCDGGYDIVAIEESRHTRNQYIIEVKRFDPTRKVGVGLVQRLYGVKTANSATKAFLVTSSSFSAQARKWARQHAWELDLKDYEDLVKWLRLHWGNDGPHPTPV